MANPRKVAVLALQKIEKENAYSNLTVKESLANAQLSPLDKSLASALIYGVLDRKITLDYILSKFLKTPINKTPVFTLTVLRSALYQILYMDKIPESAAVNEAVKLIKNSKESRNAGFVNAVLRSALRSENLIPNTNTPQDISIRFSCPLWIVESFLKDYGEENTLNILSESLKAANLYIRVNTVKTTAEELKEELKKENIECEDAFLENFLCLNKGANIANSKAFKKGLFHVQDLASGTTALKLEAKENDRVLDLCAAPGGKTFTIAQSMNNKGEIIATDIHKHRVDLIEEGKKRLALSIIKPMVSDASKYNGALGEFDKVLSDVPCSGLGVIKRKPDIKYSQTPNLKELEELQYNILTNASKYVKKGGKILYSTCTLRKAENENQIERFLKENKDFHKIYEHTFLPHLDLTDGFFCAVLERL